jgi:C4-type zinc ribbon domain
LLPHYDRVAKYRGTGLSEVRDQKCLACRVMLRPQTYNDVRNGTQTVICESCQRILYYNPANETAVAAPTFHKRRRAHPKFDTAQAWYYRPNYGDSGEVYLGFSNVRGSSTRRIYDVHNGRKLGDTLTREGEYRLGFPEDLNDSIRLNGNWPEKEMDEWGDEMPMVVLDALQRDLDLAKAEAMTPGPSSAETAASGHPAAN